MYTLRSYHHRLWRTIGTYPQLVNAVRTSRRGARIRGTSAGPVSRTVWSPDTGSTRRIRPALAPDIERSNCRPREVRHYRRRWYTPGCRKTAPATARHSERRFGCSFLGQTDLPVPRREGRPAELRC